MNIGKGMLGIMVKGLLLGGLTVSAAATATSMVQVKGNTPPAMVKAKMLRHHNPNAVLDIRLALPLRNTAQLQQFLHDVRDRSSGDYRHFLTPAQFKSQYAPTDAQVQTVLAFLTSHGIKVTGVSSSNTRIHASAKTAVLESVFGVAINDYNYKGQNFYSPSSNPLLPTTVSPLVSAVMGMDDAVTFKPHNIEGVKPKGIGFGQPSGFQPLQIATAYNWPDITDLSNGAGVTIAIATVYNFRPQDLAKFWSSMGVPAHNTANGNAVTVVPVGGTTNVLNGETTLDIERSSSMAPGAKIEVYEITNPSFVAFDDEFDAIKSDAVAQVVSTSWGGPESEQELSTIGPEHEAFEQMAAEGKVVIAAAGDNGAGDGATNPDGTPATDHADFPTSDPYVLAAGGTTLALFENDPHNPDNTIKSESAWGGAGGADSIIFAEPGYQTAAAGLSLGFASNTSCTDAIDNTAFPTTAADLCMAAGNASRQTSDMSMDANPSTGYALYYDGRWLVFGGTSFVAPELAGMFAILAGDDIANAGTGFVGPGPDLVYCAATDGNLSTNFNDITDGSNGPAGIFDAGTGWDHPTGWGTPNASVLLGDIQANCL